MALRENFRTGNPDLHFSGYPGNDFPKQCGLGGHGDYGTYGQGAFPYPPYQSGCGCGSKPAPPQAAAVSSCAPPKQNECGTTEMFAGGATAGCAMPQFWADKACRLPPNHCGSGLCSDTGDADVGSMAASGEFERKQAGFETYDGQIGDYIGAFAGLGADSVPSCGASNACAFDSCGAGVGADGPSHAPGFDQLKCGTPYSAPYQAGPKCGPTEQEWSEPQLSIYPVNAPMMAVPQLPVHRSTTMGMPTFLFNLLVAIAIAFLAYKLLKRK